MTDKILSPVHPAWEKTDKITNHTHGSNTREKVGGHASPQTASLPSGNHYFIQEELEKEIEERLIETITELNSLRAWKDKLNRQWKDNQIDVFSYKAELCSVNKKIRKFVKEKEELKQKLGELK